MPVWDRALSAGAHGVAGLFKSIAAVAIVRGPESHTADLSGLAHPLAYAGWKADPLMTCWQPQAFQKYDKTACLLR